MKKKKILIFSTFIIFLTPFLYFYLLDDINLYHPYEVVFKDDKNNIIINTLHEKKGLYITYEEVPTNFISYLLCIEDKNFFKHNGFDFFRLVKSTFHNIFSSSTQGGSTITMQLARMLFLNNEKTITRKFKEIIYALKLESALTKEKILEYYLNCTYFAHGVYGLRTASYYYFAKDVNELSLYEQAMLIGILNSPNNYSPYINLNLAKEKTFQILKTLEKNKIITIDEFYHAFETDFNLVKQNSKAQQGIDDYYLDACMQEIKNNNLLTESNYLQGLTIETYLNNDIQNYVKGIIEKINFENYNTAVVIMEGSTSKVISLIGGKDYQTSSFNRAVNAKKQIGSTIKPLLYYLALLNGFTPLKELTSEKTTFKIKDYGDYNVSNAGEIYANRKITLLEALAMSDNIYAVKTLLALGLTPLIDLLESFHVDVDVDNITLALGANSLSLLELTSIYNCIASGGIFYKPKLIKRILKDEKNILYKANSNIGTRLLFKKEAEIIRHLLRAPFDKNLKTYASPSLMNYYISDNYGAKTGSTNSSSWVIGFNKNYTIGVYVGSDDNTYLTKGYLSREIFYRIGKYLDNTNSYFNITTSVTPFRLYNSITKEHSYLYYTN